MHLGMNDRHGNYCTPPRERTDTLTVHSSIHIFCPKIFPDTQDIRWEKSKLEAFFDMANAVFYSSLPTSKNDRLDLEYHLRGICQHTCSNVAGFAL